MFLLEAVLWISGVMRPSMYHEISRSCHTLLPAMKMRDVKLSRCYTKPLEKQTGWRKEMTTSVGHGRECKVLAKSIQTSSLGKFSRDRNATRLDTEFMKRVLHKSEKRALLKYETFPALTPHTEQEYINKEKHRGNKALVTDLSYTKKEKRKENIREKNNARCIYNC